MRRKKRDMNAAKGNEKAMKPNALPALVITNLSEKGALRYFDGFFLLPQTGD